MTNLQPLQLDINRSDAARELLTRRQARNSLLQFTLYTKPNYSHAWFHQAICNELDLFEQGVIDRLMIFVPPQHGKECAHSTPVLTPNGWTTHGALKPGDYVFGRNGEPVKVLALSEDCLSEYNVEFTDGSIIQCHGNHEWIVFDRRTSKAKQKQIETKQMFSEGVWIGNRGRGGRGRFQVDENKLIAFSEKNLPIHPYVLGAWLGDGTSSSNCITHHVKDIETVNKIISVGYEITTQNTHKTTGAIRTGFTKLYKQLKYCGLMNNKHIPVNYLTSSVDQRLELIAGLIDTDGYVYHKNGRVTFSNINKRLIDDVFDLVVSLGWRATISEFQPIVSTSGVKGKNIVYQLCFNPDRQIPTAIERKKLIKINPTIRRRSIVSITKAKNPEMGRCIQVEGGVYLVGKTLIPTHNSELSSRRYPAYRLGRAPETKIALGSYSSDLAHGFNRDVQRIIDDPLYNKLFPETFLNESNVVSAAKGNYLRNSEIFETVNHKGFFKTVGVGGSLTGTPVDEMIIDDPFKDRQQANSETTRNTVWNWFTDVVETRLHNLSKVLMLFTRWHEDDLAGRVLKRDGEICKGGQWKVVRFPALMEKMDADVNDPRAIDEALWEERHSAARLLAIKKNSPTTFASLYQQRPAPLEGGIIKKHWFKIISYSEFRQIIGRNNFENDCFVDGAYTDKTSNDPSALMGCVYCEHSLFILDSTTVRKELPDLVAFSKDYTTLPNVRIAPYDIAIRIEPKASGKSLAQTLKKEGVNAVELPEYRESKETHVHNITPFLESGRCYLIKGLWNESFLHECATFPNGTHDDQVDNLCNAIDHYNQPTPYNDTDSEAYSVGW